MFIRAGACIRINMLAEFNPLLKLMHCFCSLLADCLVEMSFLSWTQPENNISISQINPRSLVSMNLDKTKSRQFQCMISSRPAHHKNTKN